MKKIILFISILATILNAKQYNYTNLERQYLEALTEYNYEQVKRSVEAGVDIDLIDSSNRPPLIRMFGSIALFQYNEKRDDAQRVKIANYLINKGIDVNAIKKDGFGQRAIEYAIIHEYRSVVKNLIEHGANTGIDYKGAKRAATFLDITPAIFSVVNTREPAKYLEYLLSIKVGNLKEKSFRGKTLLHAALSTHLDIRLVKYLIGKIDINSKMKNGKTPLIVLLYNSKNYARFDKTPREEFVKLLLDSGANEKEIYKKTGDTTVQMALKFSHSLNTIKMLLAKGVDVNHKNAKGYTALEIANYRYKDNSILEYLISKGAKVEDAHKLLRDAVATRGVGHVEYWVGKDKDINKKDEDGYTLLNIAQSSSFADIARVLKEHGAKATPKAEIKKIAKEKQEAKKSEITNIYKAIKAHNLAKVKEFYENNSTLKAKKFNLAMSSVSYGYKEALEYFLSKGADINGADKYGYNLLQQAVFKDQLEMIKYLLDKGLKLDEVKDKTLNNYILSATSSPKTFKFLTQNGLKPANDKQKQELIERALRRDNAKLVRYLVKSGYKFDKKLLESNDFISLLLDRDRAKSIKFLLDMGLDVNRVAIWREFHKGALLPLALKVGAYKCAKVLIDNRANLKSKLSSGYDYVHRLVVDSGRVELIEAMLKNGFDINYHDYSKGFNVTMLERALDRKNVKVAKFLLEHNADVKECKGSRRNLLYYSVFAGYLDITKTLVKKGADPYFIYRTNSGFMTLIDIAEGNKAMLEYLKTLNITEKKIANTLYKKYKKGKLKDEEIFTFLLRYYLNNEPKKLADIKEFKSRFNLSFGDILRKVVLNKLKESKDLKESKKLVDLLDKYKVKYSKESVLKSANDLKVFKYFLKSFSKKDKQYANSMELYKLAYDEVKYNQPKKLKALMDNGLSLKTRGDFYSILVYAVGGEYSLDLINVILKSKDIDYTQKDRDDYTAVELALIKSDIKLLDLLLPRSQKVNIRDVLIASTKANKKTQEHFRKMVKISEKKFNELLLLKLPKGGKE